MARETLKMIVNRRSKLANENPSRGLLDGDYLMRRTEWLDNMLMVPVALAAKSKARHLES